jgi:uncharacterized protein (DUF2225 family)
MTEEKKLTFFSKSAQICPLCETSFYREELLTGSGRMIAGALTDEMRRQYEPSKKFGEVSPLVYHIIVCPSCYFAAGPGDFFELPDKIKDTLRNDAEHRVKAAQVLFEGIDFNQPRGLLEGTAAYFLSIMCYDAYPKESAPTIKQGNSALRAAWTCNDLHRKLPSDNWDYLAANFYRKARFFYNRAVELEQSGKETVSGVRNLGPDLDKNYGFDGVLYIAGLLEFKYGDTQDTELRVAAITKSKRAVARIFGMGRASKNKPAAILDNAKELYDRMAKELAEAGVQVSNDVEEEQADAGA